MSNLPLIDLKNVDLEYELHYDRSSSLKEWLIDRVKGRKYVDERKAFLTAMNNISLQVHQGERLGIIGHNGAGKSTMLKVISGILKPSRGSITTRGTIQPLIEVGAGFNPEFSGRENIYLNGYMMGFSEKQIREKEQQIIDFADLKEFIDVPIKYYSTGMAVRLAFTVATAIEPELLIFDEMLGAGDAAFVSKAKKRMNELVEKAKLVILVSHDLGLIRSFCKRVIVIDHGKMIFDGPSGEAVDFYLNKVEKIKKIENKDIRLSISSVEYPGESSETKITINFSGDHLDKSENCTIRLVATTLEDRKIFTSNWNTIKNSDIKNGALLGKYTIGKYPFLSHRSLFYIECKCGDKTVKSEPTIIEKVNFPTDKLIEPIDLCIL